MMTSLHRHWGYSLSVLFHAAVVVFLVADFSPAPAAPSPVIELQMEALAIEDILPVSDPVDVVTATAPPPPPPPPPLEIVEVVEPPPVIESRVEAAPVIARPPPKPAPKPPKVVEQVPVETPPVPPVVDAPPPLPSEVKPVEMAAVSAPPVPNAPRDFQPQRAAPASLGGPPLEYSLLILQRLKRFHIYPATALRRGQHGVAHMKFRLDRTGNIVSWQMTRSSGHRILDSEAEALMRRASPMPPPPPDLADAAL
jgi:protein TonB